MARRRLSSRSFRFWQFEMPLAVAVLIGLTVVATLSCWLLDHTQAPASRLAMLVGEQVWAGEVWRLVSYLFVEAEPWNFLFGVLMLYWFGKDLCQLWGQRRFVFLYVGLAVAAAAITCLVGRFLWPSVGGTPHLGNMPVADALVILWALNFPDRVVRLYFVLEVRGRSLIWLTLAGTALFAARSGISAMTPHVAAEAIVLISALRPGRYLVFFRRAQRKRQMQKSEKAMRRYLDNVRRIDGKDDDEAPPPPGKWLN